MAWLPYSDSAMFPDVIKSLILLTIALIGRLVVIRAVLHSKSLSAEVKRRWVLTIRNTMAFLFITGLIFIWAHELSTFAVSRRDRRGRGPGHERAHSVFQRHGPPRGNERLHAR